MNYRSCAFAALTALVVALPARGTSGPRIPIPKGLPAEVALGFLRAIDDHAKELDRAFQKDGISFQFHPQTAAALSFQKPINVEVTGSDQHTLAGLAVPYTKVQVSLAVRCSCIVSYDLGRIRVEGNDLLLPEPTVHAAWADPPGERGRWTSNAALLRGRTSDAIEALKGRLLDDALVEAKRQYLHAQHSRCEAHLQETMQQYLKDKVSRMAQPAPSTTAGHPGSKLLWFAVVVLAAIVLLVALNWKNIQERL